MLESPKALSTYKKVKILRIRIYIPYWPLAQLVFLYKERYLKKKLSYMEDVTMDNQQETS